MTTKHLVRRQHVPTPKRQQNFDGHVGQENDSDMEDT